MAKFKPQNRPPKKLKRISSNDFFEAFDKAGESLDLMGRDAFNLV